MTRSKLSIKKTTKKAVSTCVSERLPETIDTVGRLQLQHDKMGARLAKLKAGLKEVVPEDFDTVEGSYFVAKKSEHSVRKLKNSASNHTLLMKMLFTIDEQQASNGGLFDMILGLDQSLVNSHFVPLLEAVFKKAQLSSDAQLLFLEDIENSIEVTPLPENA